MSATDTSRSRALVPVPAARFMPPVEAMSVVRRSTPGSTRSPLRIALAISVTIAVGTMLGTLDSPVFEDLFSGAWISRTFVETQQRQATAIASLEKTVGAIGTDVDATNARADGAVRKHQEEAAHRFTELSAEMEALKIKLASMEAAQDQSRRVQATLSERVDDLTTNLLDTKGRLAGLRSSLHDLNSGQRGSIVALTKRIERLESASGDVTASIGKPAARKTSRAVVPSRTPARADNPLPLSAEVKETPVPTRRPESGHIFDTKSFGLQDPGPAKTPPPPGV